MIYVYINTNHVGKITVHHIAMVDRMIIIPVISIDIDQYDYPWSPVHYKFMRNDKESISEDYLRTTLDKLWLGDAILRRSTMV